MSFYYGRSETRQASPGVEANISGASALIPDRVALTNERLYPRSRLLSLAKQHLIATNLKSTQIVQALLKKREEGGLRPKRRGSRVATGVQESTRSLSSVVALTLSSPAGQEENTVHTPAESPSISEESEVAELVPRMVNMGIVDSESRGRSAVRTHPMQYTRRYSVGLRGLTPSPTRGQYENISKAPVSSKQWRATKRPATPPPTRRGQHRAQTPGRTVFLVNASTPSDEDVLPLEGRGWMQYDSPFSGYGCNPFESPSGFNTGSPMVSAQ